MLEVYTALPNSPCQLPLAHIFAPAALLQRCQTPNPVIKVHSSSLLVFPAHCLFPHLAVSPFLLQRCPTSSPCSRCTPPLFHFSLLTSLFLLPCFPCAAVPNIEPVLKVHSQLKAAADYMAQVRAALEAGKTKPSLEQVRRDIPCFVF